MKKCVEWSVLIELTMKSVRKFLFLAIACIVLISNEINGEKSVFPNIVLFVADDMVCDFLSFMSKIS